MKYTENHTAKLEGNSLFINMMKEDLDMKEMPNVVDERLKSLYSELPDDMPKTPKYRTPLKVIFSSVSSIAAAVVILFSLNAANPAFAEELPFVGNIFTKINASQTSDPFRETADTERIGNLAVAVNNEGATAKTDKFEVKVEEAYYDGRFLHSSIQVKSTDKLNIDNTILKITPIINGIQIKEEYETLHYFLAESNNTYLSDFTFLIPIKNRQEKDLDIKYNVSFEDASTQTREDAGLSDYKVMDGGAMSVEFTAIYDLSESVDIADTIEQNGIKILSFYTSPAGTEVFWEKPFGSSDEYYISVHKMDGTPLDALAKRGEIIEEIWNMGNPTAKTYGRFVGLKASEKQAVLTIWGGPKNSTVAEFTVDLEKKTITPSENYKDINSPLFSVNDITESLRWVYPAYRASDEELSTLDSGYAIEFLTSGGNHKCAYLALVTPEERRNLRVELYQNNEIKAVVNSGGFQPLTSYNYIAKYGVGDIKDTRFYNGGGIVRSDEVKAALSIYPLRIEDVFFLLDDVVTIKVFDSKTKELIHEETVTLQLPEGITIGEDEMLIKERPYSGYVIINEADLLPHRNNS